MVSLTIRVRADVIMRRGRRDAPPDLTPLRRGPVRSNRAVVVFHPRKVSGPDVMPERDRTSLTRRRFVLRSAQMTAGLAAGGLVGLPAPAPARIERELVKLDPPSLPQPPYGRADYWAFADWLQPYFDPLWVPEKRLYGSGNSSVGRIYHNSLLLTTHAIAALTGHDGPTRNDERARILAQRLCDSPPWSELTLPSEPDPQFHTPGWVESLGTRDAAMDKSIDPKVAEALMYAWRARDVLGLPKQTTDLIADRISRCAHGPFFRYPSVRLNQINWNCELYAHTATVTGDTELLRLDYRAQVERFSEGIRRRLQPGGSPNLGPGYRFHYLPGAKPWHPYNLDSAEYASETCHFVMHYEAALRSGMQPIAPEYLTLLRAWIEHVVYAYWTHGGYLNWDTGYGFKRWHAGRTWALAQQGLLAIATSPRFHNASDLGAWAKYFFDRGLQLFERLSVAAPDGRGIAPANLYDVAVQPLGLSIREMFAARMQANAARAVALGLAKLPATEPPSLYSFDGDIGRLAVTTPAYNTTVLAVNQHAFPYGGIELARLYDGDQRVVANVGGRPLASFGVLVRDGSANEVLLSQRGRNELPQNPPLELLRTPRGPVRRAKPYPRRPYGGPFQTLVARGRRESREAAVETVHRFKRTHIETRWTVIRRRRKGRLTADVLFPSWGRDAKIEAVLVNGRRITLAEKGVGARRAWMRDIAYFYLAGEDSGYVVVLTDGRRGLAHILRPKRQSSAPRPGPTLALQIARQARFKRTSLTVRIAPAGGVEEAAEVAKRLRTARPKRAKPAKPRKRPKRRR